MSKNTYLMQEELPKISTKFERSLASQVDHILSLENPIGDIWNPAKCPIAILPYLAWALSVDVWDDDWEEDKKRYVVQQSFSDHKIKGTLEAQRRYIGYAGGNVVSAITAPQAFFAGAGDDDPLYDKWLKRLPELRIETKTESGIATNLTVIGSEQKGFPSQGFLGASGRSSSPDDDTVTWFCGGEIDLDDRFEAYYIENDVRTDVSVIVKNDTRRSKTGKIHEVSFNGDAACGFFTNDAASTDQFLGGSLDGQTVSLKLINGTPAGENLWNIFDVNNSKIQNVSPEKIVISSDFGHKVFCNLPLEDSFLDAEDEEERFYYSFRIQKGDFKSPSASFLDYDRLGIKPFTAELTVELLEPAIIGGLYTGMYAGDSYALPPTDLSKLWAAADAAVSAKSLTDTIYFDLDLPSKKNLRLNQTMSNLTF